MPNPEFVPDPVVKSLAPGGTLTKTSVTFRGWLSAADDGEPIGGVYRFYTSPWFDEWLEIEPAHLLARLKLEESSVIWVDREATIVKCQAADACYFADQELEMGADPTAANHAAARYPRYGG